MLSFDKACVAIITAVKTKFPNDIQCIYGGGIEVFFRRISNTRVAPGLMRHSPLSRQTPFSPYANSGGIIACTFSPTAIRETISSKPGMTALDPSLKRRASFLPSAWVASKICADQNIERNKLFPCEKVQNIDIVKSS